MHARFRLRDSRGTPARPRPPTVVLVHGLLVSSRYMAPLASRLRDDADVWAPDMPGFGRSAKPGEALDVAALALWLGRWLEVRGLNDVVVVANSFGCQYAVDLAARDPGSIRALVLAGPTMDPEHRTALEQAARWLANAPLEPPSLGLVLARDLLDSGALRVAATYRHGLRDPIEDKLPHVSVSTIVARGARDPLVDQRWAERATKLLPRGRLHVVPGAGHTLNYNAPAALAAVTRPLLSYGDGRT